MGDNEITKEEFIERITSIKDIFDSENMDAYCHQVQQLDRDTNTGDWVWYWCNVLSFGTKYNDGDVYLNNGQSVQAGTPEDLWDIIHNNSGAWRRWPK